VPALLLLANGCVNPVRAFAKALFDSAHVLRSRHKPGRRVRLLLAYWRLTLKLVTVARFVPLRRERFLGFCVESFDYATLHFLFREIFVRSEYWFECSTDRPLIFDCGANIGIATIFFKWLYPRSVIHCFEPDRPTFEMLQRNVQANQLSDVYPHNVALSDVVGAVEFFVSASRNGSLLMSLDPERTAAADHRSTIVDGAKLSDFVNGKQVDLVKLDVEGAEGAVMRDLAASGAIRKVNQFVVEYHHHVDHGKANLGDFLSLLKTARFDYQIGAVWASPQGREAFQDIMVHAFRSTSPS
jgi:FkbM family methyltransferase